MCPKGNVLLFTNFYFINIQGKNRKEIVTEIDGLPYPSSTICCVEIVGMSTS